MGLLHFKNFRSSRKKYLCCQIPTPCVYSPNEDVSLVLWWEKHRFMWPLKVNIKTTPRWSLSLINISHSPWGKYHQVWLFRKATHYIRAWGLPVVFTTLQCDTSPQETKLIKAKLLPRHFRNGNNSFYPGLIVQCATVQKNLILHFDQWGNRESRRLSSKPKVTQWADTW